jgi:putative drug exporter of the RND superfamily
VTDQPPSTRGVRTRTWPRVAATAAVVIAWLVLAGIGGPLVGRLSEVQQNDNASFLPASAESTLAAAQAKAFSGSDAVPYFVVIERPGGLRPQDRAAVQRYVSGVPELRLPGTDRTLGDFLAAPPQQPIPSQDGEALLVAVPLAGDTADEVLAGSSAVSLGATALRDAAAKDLASQGLRAYVTGPGGYIADLVTAFAGIDGVLLFVALGVVLLILLIVYRSPILPVAVLLTSVFGLAAAATVVYPLAKHGAIDLSGQSQGIMSILVVGAATDYSLLLVSRYREELHQSDDKWAAMRTAWRAAAEPIAASAATVILGLLCLMLSRLGSTRGLGPVGALAIAGALIAALTFLPAVLLLVGRRVFWPLVPHVDHVHSEENVGRRGLWGRVAGLVGRRPRTVWITTAVALGVCAAFLPTFNAQGMSQSDVFLNPVQSVVGQRELVKHFPGGLGSPVQLVVPQEKSAAAVAVAKKVDGLTDVFVGQAPGTTPKVVDGRVLVQATLRDPADSPGAEDAVQRLRSDLDRVDPGVLVGGTTAATLDVRHASERDLRVVIPAILAVIFVVLMLLLRSLVAPVILVLANVLSFAATLGVSALMFNHVFDYPSSDPSMPLYGFVFLVALGIDYSIFLMTRVREESRRRGTRPGVLVGLTVTGGVITSAGVVLAATFSALAVLPILFLAQIAFIVAFGVLLDTLVVRVLLLPAFVHEIGHRVWWPGVLGRHLGRHEEGALRDRRRTP